VKQRSIPYSEVRAAVQRWAILSDERMPKTDADSLREIERHFEFVSKIAMFVDLGLGTDFDEEEAVAVDSIDDIIALLKKYNVRVTGRLKA